MIVKLLAVSQFHSATRIKYLLVQLDRNSSQRIFYPPPMCSEWKILESVSRATIQDMNVPVSGAKHNLQIAIGVKIASSDAL